MNPPQFPQPPSEEDAEWIATQLETFAYEAVRERGMHPWAASMVTMAFAREFRQQAILNAGLVGDSELFGADSDALGGERE